jgi:hypothetical protein
MDLRDVKILSNREVLIALGRNEDLPIQVNKDYYKKLKTNLLVPSTNQTYSCAIEYISNWFYSKFPDNFFKSKYIESSHIFEQLNRMKKRELLSITKPAAVIKENMDMAFNRENLDQYNFGNLIYNNRASYKDAFFIDKERHLFISMTMEMLLLNFSFSIMVPTQGLQHDLAKECQLAFRAGATQKHYNDVDFHVPEELLSQLANDTNRFVCPCSGHIKDAIEFVHYFNMHSTLPLLYKFNAATGTMQYYLKMPRCVVHIRTNEIQIDEGVRQGHLMNNYNITFDCQVRFPTPKFYAYYSMVVRESVRCLSKLDNDSFVVSVTSLANIPNKNSKGWQWNIQTEYTFTDPKDIKDIQDGKLMHIDFKELIGDLRDVIDSTKTLAISPDVFLDVHIYNKFRMVKTSVDWQEYRINMLESIEVAQCYIIIYMDNSYYAEQLTNMKEYDKYRTQTSDTNIEHKRLDYKKNLKRSSLDRISDKVLDTSETDTKG